MKIRLIWVGKTKEPFIDEGIRKYVGLLRPYAEVGITEVREEKGKDVQMMLRREGEKIMKTDRPYILLDERGKNLSSVQFADFIAKSGREIRFVLGGAYGVSDDVKRSAAETISLSRMTLTHEMSRLLLTEQIFRAFTIIHKRGYHH